MSSRRILLVGCGRMSAALLRAIGKIGGIGLVDLVDLDSAVAQAQAQEFGLADLGLDELFIVYPGRDRYYPLSERITVLPLEGLHSLVFT